MSTKRGFYHKKCFSCIKCKTQIGYFNAIEGPDDEVKQNNPTISVFFHFKIFHIFPHSSRLHIPFFVFRSTARFAINAIMDLEDTTNSEKKRNFHATKSLPKLALDAKVYSSNGVVFLTLLIRRGLHMLFHNSY